jgi:hypothetical protein
MRLLDAWTALAPFDLARLLGLPAAVLISALLADRRISAGVSVFAAAAVAMMGELAVPWPVRFAWAALWLLVAWQVGARERERPHAARRRGALEAGAVALPLGSGLLLLMLAALSRESLVPLDARRASLGALLVGAGLLHLMLRRHIRRALIAYSALGLGLELLASSARRIDVLHAGAPAGAALAGALAAIALTSRLAGSREEFAGSPLVGDAHELHD